MINVEIVDGKVKLGKLESGKKSVVFYSKKMNPFFVRVRKGGSPLVDDFLQSVLGQVEFMHAHDHAKIMVKLHNSPKLYYKYLYQYCTNLLGKTPIQAMKSWNAAEYYTKIEPRKFLVDKLARRQKGRVHIPNFVKIINNEALLKQVEKDNLCHLLPLVNALGMSPQELRKFLGKSLWKSLAANSFSRNLLIALRLDNRLQEYLQEDKIPDILRDLQALRSTLLSNKPYVSIYLDNKGNEDIFDYVLNEKAKGLPMSQYTRRILLQVGRRIRYLTDIKQMADSFGEEFKVRKFNAKQLDELHERYVKMTNERIYSDDQIEWLMNLPFKVLKFGEYSIEILQSKKAIHQEGLDMGHCVANYAVNVAAGGYLVLSLKKNGEKISTLGLRKNTSGEFGFSQHYDRFNQEPKDMNQIFIADVAIDTLNGKIKDGQKQLDLTLESTYDAETYFSKYDHRFTKQIKEHYIPVNLHVAIN